MVDAYSKRSKGPPKLGLPLAPESVMQQFYQSYFAAF